MFENMLIKFNVSVRARVCIVVRVRARDSTKIRQIEEVGTCFPKYCSLFIIAVKIA